MNADVLKMRKRVEAIKRSLAKLADERMDLLSEIHQAETACEHVWLEAVFVKDTVARECNACGRVETRTVRF